MWPLVPGHAHYVCVHEQGTSLAAALMQGGSEVCTQQYTNTHNPETLPQKIAQHTAAVQVEGQESRTTQMVSHDQLHMSSNACAQ
jgi:predicted NBD/HSP70 family sugar kinase